MRLLKTASMALIAALSFAAPNAHAATASWKHACTGPDHACRPAATEAKAKQKHVAHRQTTQQKPVRHTAAKKAKAHVAHKPAKAAKVATAAKKSRKSGSSEGYQSGVASWYGGKFHGRKTANGETYDQWSLTAAHRSLPFGTRVRVTNQSNGDSVVVRINDRGPFVGGRVIDLSRAAASEIGMGGLAHVKLTVLGKG